LYKRAYADFGFNKIKIVIRGKLADSLVKEIAKYLDRPIITN
jgi:hypothetical protein